jgi:predicted MFS family arabinose efflux permease
VLLVCSGAGAIAGALIVAALEKLKEHGRVVLLTLIGLGASTCAFALNKRLPLACLLIFASGATIMASLSILLSLVQLIITDQMRGRVMSVFNLALRLGIPVGSLTLGKIIPIVGVAPALAGTGLALIGFALYFVVAMRDTAIFQRSVRESV